MYETSKPYCIKFARNGKVVFIYSENVILFSLIVLDLPMVDQLV